MLDSVICRYPTTKFEWLYGYVTPHVTDWDYSHRICTPRRYARTGEGALLLSPIGRQINWGTHVTWNLIMDQKHKDMKAYYLSSLFRLRRAL